VREDGNANICAKRFAERKSDSLMAQVYFDAGDLEEDRRIEIIGHQAMVHHKVVGFITDCEGKDGWEKADRYVRKLKEKFPGIREMDRSKGPVPGTVAVKVGPPLN
jgi:hypothetical protein